MGEFPTPPPSKPTPPPCQCLPSPAQGVGRDESKGVRWRESPPSAMAQAPGGLETLQGGCHRKSWRRRPEGGRGQAYVRFVRSGSVAEQPVGATGWRRRGSCLCHFESWPLRIPPGKGVWGSGESLGNFVCFQISTCFCFPSIVLYVTKAVGPLRKKIKTQNDIPHQPDPRWPLSCLTSHAGLLCKLCVPDVSGVSCIFLTEPTQTRTLAQMLATKLMWT